MVSLQRRREPFFLQNVPRYSSDIVCSHALFLKSLFALLFAFLINDLYRVDEDTQSACANMGVEGVIWIEPTDNPVVGAFQELLDDFDLPFSKANAVRARGHAVGKPYEEFW
jgi:hypothetical protein